LSLPNLVSNWYVYYKKHEKFAFLGWRYKM